MMEPMRAAELKTTNQHKCWGKWETDGTQMAEKMENGSINMT